MGDFNLSDDMIIRASTAGSSEPRSSISHSLASGGDGGGDEVFQSSTKHKIHLMESEETLLAALFCRVQDCNGMGTATGTPILGDPYAQATLDRCEVDLNRSTFSAGLSQGAVTWAANRAKTLDEWCVDFVNSRLDGPVTVLHLGCGLDGRYLRVRDRFKRNESEVHWVDVDRPMVVNLRDKIFRRPSSGDYTLRTLDLSHTGWARDIPTGRPTLVIAEGLLYYLPPEMVQNIFAEVVEYFGQGQIIFDKLGTLSITMTSRVKFLRSSRSLFKWGVDEPTEIEAFHPRLKLKDCVDKSSFMSGCIPIYGKMNSLVSVHPGDKYNGQFLRFDF